MRPRLVLVLALPLLIAVWLAGASPASAHDQLVGSNPDAGTDLHKAPSSLRLTFSDTVSDRGVAIRVTDAAGKQLQTGEPKIAEDVVTQQLKPTRTAGTVQVVWRVTSADGHPVSGNFDYSINAADAKTTSAASDAPSSASSGGLQRSTGSKSSAETSYATSAPSFQQPTDKTNNEPLLIIGAAVLALLVVGGIAALVRQRARGDDADL